MGAFDNELDMNNIHVKHNGKEISIAQHKKYDGDKWVDTRVQEVAIVPDEYGTEYSIHLFGATLDELIECLQKVKAELESDALADLDEIDKMFDLFVERSQA